MAYTMRSKNIYRITGFLPNINPSCRHMLCVLGMYPGKEFTVINTAPFGDPIYIRTSRNLNFALRKKDLCCLKLDKVNKY